MDQQPGEVVPRCPECGAALQPGLAACTACGAPVVGAPPATSAPSVDSALVDSAALAPTAFPQPADTARPTAITEASGEWRCGWCGHISPAGAGRCAHCNAVRPSPEADAALLRQAEERMRAEMETLDVMRRRRRRKGLGRLFSN